MIFYNKQRKFVWFSKLILNFLNFTLFVLQQIQQMNKGGKQRNESKNILKQKLISYQNEINKEPQIVIYDGFRTTDSQKLGQSNMFKNQLSKPKCRKLSEYDRYLNCNTQEEDYLYNKKSLTRQTIFSINKKAKAIRISLNEMAKNKHSYENCFTPFSSMECQRIITPQKRDKALWLHQKEQNIKDLDNILTIRKQKNSKTERSALTSRRIFSQQRYRSKQNLVDKPFSSQIRPKTSKTQSFSQKINPETPLQLTEYFTPCYHKQSKTGYIVNDFQPRLRAKHFEDNVKVMAKVIKKKILNLQRQEIVNYLRRIGEKKKYSQPDAKIRQIVRKTNYTHQKNAIKQKINKGSKIKSSKQSLHKNI